MEDLNLISDNNKVNDLNEIENDYYKIDDENNIRIYEKKLKVKYSKYVNEIINDWKIEGIYTIIENNYLIALFQCTCIYCGRTIRRGVDGFFYCPYDCSCKSEMKREWEKIKNSGIYNSEQDYIDEKKKDFTKRFYLIDPNGEYKKENLLFGTLSDLYTFYNNNKEIKNKIMNKDFDSKQEIQCKCCGKILKKSNQLNQCDNCRAIIYNKKDFRYELISCHYSRKKELDTIITRNYKPISMSYYNTDIKIDIYRTMDSVLPYYAYINGNLERLGITKISNFNQKRIIGNFTFYFNNLGYINFPNIYVSFPADKSNISRPMIFNKNNGEYQIYMDNYKILKEQDLDDIKLLLLSENEDGEIIVNLYENDELILSLNNVKRIIQIFNFKNVLIENNDNRKYILDVNSNKLYDYNLGVPNHEYKFTDTFTNIDIDLNTDLISKNVKTIISTNLSNKVKYTECKKIYIKEDFTKNNTVLLQYLKEKGYINKLKNEFDDDTTSNYLALIPWKDRETIDFAEFITTMNDKVKYTDSYTYNIYDLPLNGVVSVLLSNTSFKMQVINFIKESTILKVEDKTKIDNIAYIIMNSYKYLDDVYVKIKNKLMKKYNANELELLLILISKYGEEIVLNFNRCLNLQVQNGRIYYEYNQEENNKKYHEIISSLKIDDVRWKSEYLMFRLVKKYFNEAVFQYRCKELGALSLDVYIPSIKIGFEYQGLQHYKPVDFFGGLEHFEVQKKNDMKKKEICNSNKIDLIEWKYNEPINKFELDKKLIKYEEKIKKIYNFINI